MPSGEGLREYDPSCNWTYEGNWTEGHIDGKGVYQSAAYGVYEGEWANDQREGDGKIKYPNGWTYEGRWKGDLFHGVGKLTCASSPLLSYEGEFERGRFNGKGIARFRNNDVYEGHFKDNQLHGSGIYIFANDVKLEAKWSRGRPEGKATVTGSGHSDADSWQYSGNFKGAALCASDRPSLIVCSSRAIAACCFAALRINQLGAPTAAASAIDQHVVLLKAPSCHVDEYCSVTVTVIVIGVGIALL